MERKESTWLQPRRCLLEPNTRRCSISASSYRASIIRLSASRNSADSVAGEGDPASVSSERRIFSASAACPVSMHSSARASFTAREVGCLSPSCEG
jgi:hypothetical protein